MTIIVFYRGLINGKSVERFDGVVSQSADVDDGQRLVIRLNLKQTKHKSSLHVIPLSDVANMQLIP